jgi:hypothetical protein
MRKTFGIDRGAFLDHFDSGGVAMSIHQYVQIPFQPHALKNRPLNLKLPQHHALILAWAALVILYGDTDSSPSLLRGGN